MDVDSPLRWVRRTVFRATQAELAAIGGVSRTRVTRYEAGGEDPPMHFLRRLREEAKRRGEELSGDWFFEIPPAGCAAADGVADDVQ